MSSRRNQQKTQNNAKGRKLPPNFRIAMAVAFRDIAIASINKGQLPIFGVIFLMAIILIRMPEKALGELAFSMLDAIRSNTLTGYILAILITILWFGHARKMRKEFTEEYKLIGREKSKLQGIAANTTYQSSDKV